MPSFILALLLFLTVDPVAADNEMATFVNLKRSFPDWRPNAVLDIGANVGGWTNKLLREVYEGDDAPSVLMLEATEKHRTSLERVKNEFKKVDFRIDVFAAQDNIMIKFYQAENTGNSIFRENTVHYKNDAGIERRAVTVDTAVAESFLKDERIDYVKLDVQGGELLVLQGASKVLEEASFVQFEASAVAYNAGGACLSDVDELLQRSGFRLYDIGEIIRRRDVFKSPGIGQFDVLYIRPASRHVPEQLKMEGAEFCRPLFLSNTNTTSRKADTSEKDSAVTDSAMGMFESFTGKYYFVQHALIIVPVFFGGYMFGKGRNRPAKSPRSVV